MAPMTWNGSQIIYNKVIRPIFLRHEATVDNMVSNLGGKAMDAAENLTREGALHFLVALCPGTSSQLLFFVFLMLFGSASSVLTTLMKNKALVTPAAPPEAKSLPSSSAAETSADKVSQSDPSDERRVHAQLLPALLLN